MAGVITDMAEGADIRTEGEEGIIEVALWLVIIAVVIPMVVLGARGMKLIP